MIDVNSLSDHTLVVLTRAISTSSAANMKSY